MFCTFWLRNVLRATTACTFSTSQLPKVVRDRQFLTLLTSKCASRHNGVQFFIAPVASWLRTRRFSEPTFRPSGAINHWKNTVFRDFPTFSRICIFCLLTLSLLIFSLLIFLFSLPLPCSAFHLSILSEVWLLNFLRIFIFILFIFIFIINYIHRDIRFIHFTIICTCHGFSWLIVSRSENCQNCRCSDRCVIANRPSSGFVGHPRSGGEECGQRQGLRWIVWELGQVVHTEPKKKRSRSSVLVIGNEVESGEGQLPLGSMNVSSWAFRYAWRLVKSCFVEFGGCDFGQWRPGTATGTGTKTILGSEGWA